MANILGVITADSVWIVNTDVDPRLSGGTTAPIGSIAVPSDGSGIFSKTGATSIDWTLLVTEPTATVTTTTAAVTTLKTIPIPANTALLINASVVCRKSAGTGAGATGDANGYVRTVIAKNVAGVVTLGTIQATYTSENIAAFNATFVVSGTNVIVQVTGAASDTVEWGCIVKKVDI